MDDDLGVLLFIGLVAFVFVVLVFVFASSEEPPVFDCGKTEAMVWVDEGDDTKCVSTYEMEEVG